MEQQLDSVSSLRERWGGEVYVVGEFDDSRFGEGRELALRRAIEVRNQFVTRGVPAHEIWVRVQPSEGAFVLDEQGRPFPPMDRVIFWPPQALAAAFDTDRRARAAGYRVLEC